MLLPTEVDRDSTTAPTLASSASLISLALPGLSSEISMEQLFSMDWVTMAADCWGQDASSLLGPHCLLPRAPGRDLAKACKEGRGGA